MLIYIVITVLILVVLFCLCCKLHMRVIEGAIPTLLILMIIEVVMMIWFILSAVPFENIGSSFCHWITNVTVTTVTVSIVGILVGVAIYFPTYLCACCWKSFCQRIRSRRSQCPATEQNEEFEQQPAHLTEHGNATKSKDGISYSRVTTETSPLINHLTETEHHSDPSRTWYSISYSQVTTNM